MATLPAAVALFARGDVKPAKEHVIAALDKEREIDALRGSRAWELVNAGHAGVPRETALLHRVALVTGDGKPGAKPDSDFPKPRGPRYESDTGELLWDLTKKDKGVVTVNAVKSKAVIGYGGGKRFDLGGVVIEPGQTLQDGWCTITLTVMEGDLAKGPARLLLTATGTAENTDMKWKGSDKESVGRDWGKAPSLVEGISASITLARPAASVRAHALDERGQHKSPLPIHNSDGKATVHIDPQARTLWYEIELK
jgi:hypothetical protein